MTNERYRAKQRAIKANDMVCFYCGRVCIVKELCIDHVFPKSRGGTHEKSNLVNACKKCNLLKRDLSLREFLEKILDERFGIQCRLEYLRIVTNKLLNIKDKMEEAGKWECDSQ